MDIKERELLLREIYELGDIALAPFLHLELDDEEENND